jgi:ABC-type branched-subunit amino acid transport system permease subunit
MNGIFSLEFWTYVGVLVAIYTIFGLGVQLQFGIAGLFNFGQSAFLAISAYTMAILIVKVGLPTPVAMIAGIGGSVVFGVLLGIPTVRLRADYLAMATIAAAEIVRYTANNFTGLTGGALGTVNLNGPTSVATYTTGWNGFTGAIQDFLKSIFGDGVPSDLSMFVVCWVIAVILLFAISRMVASPWGRLLKAIREDDVPVAAMGKRAFRYRLQVLAIGGGLAGAAGVLYALELQNFAPMDFLPIITFNAYVIVVLAGLGQIWPVAIGAFLFSFMDSATRLLNVWPVNTLSDGNRAYLRFLIVGVVLMSLVMWRPQGLFGKREEMIFER